VYICGKKKTAVFEEKGRAGVQQREVSQKGEEAVLCRAKNSDQRVGQERGLPAGKKPLLKRGEP